MHKIHLSVCVVSKTYVFGIIYGSTTHSEVKPLEVAVLCFKHSPVKRGPALLAYSRMPCRHPSYPYIIEQRTHQRVTSVIRILHPIHGSAPLVDWEGPLLLTQSADIRLNEDCKHHSGKDIMNRTIRHTDMTSKHWSSYSAQRYFQLTKRLSTGQIKHV